MKSGRFFVTVVAILGMALATACTINRDRERAGQNEENHQKDLVKEGNAKIKQSTDLQNELASKFKLVIGSEAKSESALKFNWRVVPKNDRHEIEAKLAQLLQVINRILEIDAARNITIENRDKIVNARNSAEAFQKGLESFEQTFGQGYDPKNDATISVHARHTEDQVDND